MMLHYQLVQEAPPRGLLLVLHGILGSGGNWRSFARRLVAARPEMGVALVDLRMHGASQPLPPPHSLGSAAADLGALTAALPAPVTAVLGHSFGGKVALRFLTLAPPSLRQAWIIDSTPSARPDARGSEGVLQVLAALRALDSTAGTDREARGAAVFDRRESFVAALTAGGRGIDVAQAQWLAMNLRGEPGGYRLLLDLDAIEDMLWDYFRSDLWPLLDPPPPGVQVHLVAGGRSRVLDEQDRARAAQLGAQSGRVSLHVLPRAGHYVHVDDPDGLLALMTA